MFPTLWDGQFLHQYWLTDNSTVDFQRMKRDSDNRKASFFTIFYVNFKRHLDFCLLVCFTQQTFTHKMLILFQQNIWHTNTHTRAGSHEQEVMSRKWPPWTAQNHSKYQVYSCGIINTNFPSLSKLWEHYKSLCDDVSTGVINTTCIEIYIFWMSHCMY